LKARESVSNYEEQLKNYSSYVADEIKNVIGTVGPRESGEESEHQAQDYVADSMKNTADSVVKEKFTLSPKAFMGWVLVDGIAMLISSILLNTVLFGLTTAVAVKIVMLILTLISTVLILGEFLFYKELLDPFFPKRETYNVVCTRKSAGETKKRIVFSGHVDSAYEWYYTYLGGGKFLTAMIVTEIVSLVANLIIDILVLCGVTVPFLVVIMKIFGIISIPAFISVIFFVNWRRCVPGANDNLTGVFASMAVMKYLADNNIRFENTEVVAMSTACEEAGLRGAKAYAKAHAQEIKDSGIETVVVCVDTLRDYDYMGIYAKDMSGTVKNDERTAALVKEASKVAGLDLPYANVFFGSSDAAALTQGGIRACCLAAMDPTPARYYHTRLDTADNLDERSIYAGLDTMLEAAFLFDEKGLEF